MKIAYVNETCGTGSIGKLTLDLMRDLAPRGITSYCFCAQGGTETPRTFQIGSGPDHKLHALFSRMTGLQGYFSHLATAGLTRRLKKIGADIVVLENLHSNYINLKMLLTYLRENDIPTVVILHDCWMYTGKCTYYVPANCAKWQTECGDCPLLHLDMVNPTWFFDRTGKCFRDKRKLLSALPRLHIVGPSDWVADEARRSFLGKFPIQTIRNWVDTNIFKPADAGDLRAKHRLQGKKIVLMVSSRLSTIKGYDEMRYLAENLSGSYQLLVIGRNSRHLPLPGNIVHIPYTADQKELAAYYSMADVCVNTTRYETFGMVTAEALCCGTPVIVYDNTASPELVDEQCGYVVRNGDREAIVSAIHAICRNGKKYYADQCADAGREKFGKARAMDEYLNLFRKIAGENS